MSPFGFNEEAIPCFRSVYRFALRLTRGHEAEAEDIAQETFLRAYRRWETYSPGTNCRSWLFTICRNVHTRRNEGKWRWAVQLAADLGLEDVSGLVEGSTEDAEAQFFDSVVDARVARAIGALPEEFRQAVVLCDLEGMSYTEISALLGVPEGTVKSRIHRGRRLLQHALHGYAVELGYIPASTN